jgi:hypothetical protein
VSKERIFPADMQEEKNTHVQGMQEKNTHRQDMQYREHTYVGHAVKKHSNADML